MVEVIAVTGILAVLAAVVVSGTQAARSSTEKAQEVSAGRNLIAAYQLAATDNDGRYLPGYARQISEIQMPDGSVKSGPPAHRYPYRLAAYMDYKLDGTILLSRNSNQIDTSNSYSVSLHPTFGINYKYLGGDQDSNGNLDLPNEVLTRTSQGANILAFASAGTGQPGQGTIYGYNILTPPSAYGALWSNAPWKEESNPANYGNVHARHGGKAVCVFLDGSIRILAIEDLRDMRLWSKNALDADNASYTVSPPPRPTGRR